MPEEAPKPLVEEEPNPAKWAYISHAFPYFCVELDAHKKIFKNIKVYNYIPPGVLLNAGRPNPVDGALVAGAAPGSNILLQLSKKKLTNKSANKS